MFRYVLLLFASDLCAADLQLANLQESLTKTTSTHEAFKGNPLEAYSVTRAPFAKAIDAFSALANELPHDPHNVKLQASSLVKNKDNMFWPLGLNRHMLRALKESSDSTVQQSDDPTFKSSINPRLLDPELRKKQIQEFNDNDRIIYVEDFFDDATFARMQKEAARLWKSPDLEINCNLDGVNRLGGYVLDSNTANENSFYNLVYANLDLAAWVSTIYETPMFPSDFPIELREYGVKSKGMPCHRDLLLFQELRIDAEFLFTLFNNSTCIATFEDAKGVTHEIKTKANSLVMVQPGASMHCVNCKPTKPGGFREVMKWIFTGTYAKDKDFDMYAENNCGQSGSNWKEIMRRRSAGGEEEII